MAQGPSRQIRHDPAGRGLRQVYGAAPHARRLPQRCRFLRDVAAFLQSPTEESPENFATVPTLPGAVIPGEAVMGQDALVGVLKPEIEAHLARGWVAHSDTPNSLREDRKPGG
jgi:hypothetical protein